MSLDELDYNLLESWKRVSERCRADPVEAWKRWRRQSGYTLAGPPRAWCLSIRASDTRIVRQHLRKPDSPRIRIEPDEAVGYKEWHEVEMDGVVPVPAEKEVREAS